MKKIFAILFVCLLSCGCMKYSADDALKDFKENVEKTKAYKLKGDLSIINNDDTYNYKVEVAYSKNENFRVSLKNKTNNHEQVILKNKDGVYVLTPSLNKSFKFQSDWPYNNSQTYLLQTLLSDIQNDKDRTFKESGKGYVFTSKVNYPNNEDLVKQNIYFDKKMNPTKVEVLNKNGDALIKMNITSIDMKAKFNDKYFNLNESMKTAKTNMDDTKSVSKIETETYPMYVPEGTQLTNTEKLNIDGGERVIMTFEGENPFMLVQELTSSSKDMEVVSVYGEPYVLPTGIAAVSDNMISWVDNNIEYYVVADNMDDDELMTVASSIAVLPASK